LRPSSTLRDFSRVIAFLLLLDKSSEDTSGGRGLQRLALSSNPLRHSSANLLFTDPSKRSSCKVELDGADCFTFEEFGVGSKAEGFQHVGLHLL
jgi:hypothetical protein